MYATTFKEKVIRIKSEIWSVKVHAELKEVAKKIKQFQGKNF